MNPAFAGNLIGDGASFEVGLDGCHLAIQSGRLHGECASVVLETDRTTAAHGLYSLKFTQPSGCRSRYGLFYKPVVLEAGKPYTVSAYLKSAEEGRQVSLALGGFPSQRGKGARWQPYVKMFQLTSLWTRYELRVPNPRRSAPAQGKPNRGLYYVAVLPGETTETCWIDGVQLEEGSAGAFSTGKGLEVSVCSSRPGNLFSPGERIVPKVSLYAPEPVGPATVSYRVVDVLGDEVAVAGKELKLPRDGHVTTELDGFAMPGRGWAMIEVTASCGGRQEKEYLAVAVMKKLPRPLADQPCQFGFDFNAIVSPDDFGVGETWHESNVHLNLDRVFRIASRAGVRWQRAADIPRWDKRPGRFGTSCEVSPGKFMFCDDAVKAIKSYGLEIMGTLGNANARQRFCPEWAESDRDSRRAPIPTTEAWRRYVRTMVGHYKDEIHTWEIVNEPNTAFWARDYLPLLRAAYEEAKAADPARTKEGD